MFQGFFISAAIFYILNTIFPVPDMDQIDCVDVYGTFTDAEARRVGVAPLHDGSSILGITPTSIEVEIPEKANEGGKRV
jgi:NCS1 family nucleobase:cation symporter-1